MICVNIATSQYLNLRWSRVRFTAGNDTANTHEYRHSHAIESYTSKNRPTFSREQQVISLVEMGVTAQNNAMHFENISVIDFFY